MLARLLLTVVAAGLVAALWGFWYEPSSLRVRQWQVDLADWPPACEGLAIGVLADLHVGSPYQGLDSLRELVQTTNASEPDLILLAGDYVIQGVVGGSFVAPELAATVLAQLVAPMGVFAVLGNHDWWLGAERVQAALERAGIRVIEDRNEAVALGACRLNIAGISDYWEGPHDLERALAGIDMHHPTVALTHNPDIFPELPPVVDLLIAGHTHGGQVALPLIGRPIVPSEYGQRYAIGHVREDDRDLFVSTGVGTSIIPVRVRVPPELSLVTLVARP